MLWQAVALAAVLAAIGSVLATPEVLARHLRGHAEMSLRADVVVAAGIAFVLAATIVLRLAVVIVRLGWRTRRRRQWQRDMLDLLDTAHSADLHVLSGDVPLAYCVPGRKPKVVVSAAALELLSPDQTAAVVAHERAHLRARHDLVLEAFTALHVAFPRFVRSKAALDAVNQLLEMLADDDAARRVGATRLHQALDKLSHTADAEEVVAARSQRLEPSPTSAEQASPRLLSALAYSAAAAILAVPTFTVVTPWLTTALAAAGFAL